MQIGGSEAGLVSLLADDDQMQAAVGDTRVARDAGGVGAPFENVAWDADGARNAAVVAYLVVAADVEQEGSCVLGRKRLLRREADE